MLCIYYRPISAVCNIDVLKNTPWATWHYRFYVNVTRQQKHPVTFRYYVNYFLDFCDIIGLVRCDIYGRSPKVMLECYLDPVLTAVGVTMLG